MTPVMYTDLSGHFPISILIGLIVGGIVGASIGGVAAYDVAKSNGVEGWELFGWTVFGIVGGGIIGAGIGAGIGYMVPYISSFVGTTFSLSIPGLSISGGAVAITSTIISVTGAQIIGAATLALTGVLMFASKNRPRSNVAQNKQFSGAAKSLGLDLKSPKVRTTLNEIHQYIRNEGLNLGWKELVELIKIWFGMY